MDLIDNAGAWFLFMIVLLVIFGMLLLGVLFLGLLLSCAWRWLSRYSVGNVVVFVERKAIDNAQR